MQRVGFVLSHEQFPAPDLLDFAAEAERAGFDEVWTSDHFHPWMDNQGHAGQAWITLAALGQRTNLRMGTGVTCPTYRYNPAIVAQAFASLGVLYPGRVFLGVGAGEAVNEYPVTGQFGRYPERHDRLIEAIEIIRRLWAGEWLSYQGVHFNITDAHLYDLPSKPIPIYVAAEGPESARLAGRYGDGLITDAKSAIEPKMRQAFRAGAQEAGKNVDDMPVFAELFVSRSDRAAAQDEAKKWWFIAHSWDRYVHVDDPRTIYEEASQQVPIEDVLNMMTVSPDPEAHVEKIRQLFDQGVTDVMIHSGEANQRGFIRWYSENVLSHVRIGQGVAPR